MARTGTLLLFPFVLLAQSTPPLARGVLLESEVHSGSGEFSIRAADDHVFRYRFDSKTYIELEDRSVNIAALRTGDRLEVMSDDEPGSALRYARTVHVVEAPRTAARRPRPQSHVWSDPLELLAPVGNLTYAGVVSRQGGGQLTLRTRDNGSQMLLLRPDTRYVENGATVDAAALKPNMRVFVRAGKNLYGEVEAYQIVWGHILEPHP
ncbi:MAG TPA: hypothetical protein VG675_22615 [Bryobacteraceae bacterium]|nr:hypothetical protein [Bryobacteraceae bacterium]